MKYYTLKETAAALDWKESKVRDWIKKGYLKAEKGDKVGLLPKFWYVAETEIRRVRGDD